MFDKTFYLRTQQEIQTKYSNLYSACDLNEDGIVDCDTWSSQSRKILFMLKETNQLSGSLIEFLHAGAIGTLWNNVVRWTHALQFTNGTQNYSDVNSISIDKRQEFLRKIAVVNFKKVPGSATAFHNEITEAANTNSPILWAQIKAISPDIIVCGGTKYYFEQTFSINNLDIQSTSNGIEYCYFNDIPVFFFYHPSARLNAESMYNALSMAAKEVLK